MNFHDQPDEQAEQPLPEGAPTLLFQSNTSEALDGTQLRSFIALRRKELRLTQSALSIASGLPLGTVSGLESGRMVRCPRGVTLEKLARGLQVPYGQLDALARGKAWEGEAPSPSLRASSGLAGEDPVLRMFMEVMGSEAVPEAERLMLQAKIRVLHQRHLSPKA